MALSPGDKLGPYEILAPIGAGGMGEVWKARDMRLDRIVAIKTSKQKFSARLARGRRDIADSPELLVKVEQVSFGYNQCS
jgi:eukaryotic-like serine/threonine-protein kinase